MLLMPSRYEPGGQTQLHALRYGTIPIVRETGGLADTVQNYDAKSESGTGFVFKKFEPGDMVKSLERAIKVFLDKKRWAKLMKNAMMQDYSWEAAAEKYTKLYARLSARGRK
jgi:starch synthase